MNTIERTDKIDAYLAGTMPDAEKKEFERLLLDPETSLEDRNKLQDEMELQKEIIHAIRRRGFREMVAKELKKIEAEEAEKAHRRKIIAYWSLGGSGMMAIAAVMLMLLVIAPMARQMQELSTQYAMQFDVSDTRGGDEYEESLNNAIVLMQDNQWNEAGVIIDEVYCKTQDEPGEYAKEIHEFAEWLKAIWLMHEGKVYKAKKLLHKISESESFYRLPAAEMLEKLK